jgi:hypothetical protein
MTRVVNIAQSGGNNVTMRNRIINGGMAINQRGGTVTFDTAGTYMLDRWTQNSGGSAVITGSQSNSGPANSSQYSLQVSVTTGSAPAAGNLRYFAQFIEGYNVADLWYGTSSASTVTVSFWVRSSVTGTYCVALQNSASNRSYVANFTVNVANTWEQKSVTIAGDQSGTWLITNGVGLRVYFDVGSGTTYETTANTWAAGNYTRTSGAVSLSSTTGANFYITGVQLEAGTTATPFENRLYGTELALCQRYYEILVYDPSTDAIISWQFAASNMWFQYYYRVSKRAIPTFTIVTGSWLGTTPTIHLGLTQSSMNATAFFYLAGTSGNTACSFSAEL